MTWRRLYITVEGQAEKAFADLALAPHFANYELEVKARVVVTNRRLGKRGGVLDFETIRGDLARLMRQDPHPDAYFTTMLDLYALPSTFPGWSDSNGKPALEKVITLEQALKADLADRRFDPYIQLHEFEALLFCDLNHLETRISDSHRALAHLGAEVVGLKPEEINEGALTAPSKRIIRHLPIYERVKVRVGAQAAAAIGLPALRMKCPHFNEWLERLEQL